MGGQPSELLRALEKLPDALEKSAGRASVEDAVVKTEDEFRLHPRHEFALFLVPHRHLASGHESQDEVLLGPGTGAGGGDAEGVG